MTLFTSKRGLSDGSNQFEQVSNDPIGVLCLIMPSYHLNGVPPHVHPPRDDLWCAFLVLFSNMHVVPGIKFGGGVVPHFLPIIGKCQMVPGTILGGGVKSARKDQKTI